MYIHRIYYITCSYYQHNAYYRLHMPFKLTNVSMKTFSTYHLLLLMEVMGKKGIIIKGYLGFRWYMKS